MTLAEHIKAVDTYLNEEKARGAKVEDARLRLLGTKGQEYRERCQEVERLQAEFDEWQGKYKPKIEPFDTPARIAADIAAKRAWIEKRREELLAYSPLGNAVLDGENAKEKQEDEYRRLYRESRGRALAFRQYIPDVAEKLPVIADALLGLQNIAEWCHAIGDGTTPGNGTVWRMPDEPLTDAQRETLILLAKCKPLTGLLEKDLRGDFPRQQWQRDVKPVLERLFLMANKKNYGYYLPENVKQAVISALNNRASTARLT